MDVLLTCAILALLVLVAARIERVSTRNVSGTVVVNDGDSLTLGSVRIRLTGIDAPEFNQICRRGGIDYACGREARSALVSLIAAMRVECTGWETDRYGRLLAVCRAGATDLNRAQVEAGWAVAYGDYGDAERVARDARKGIWSGTFDRPRDWRDHHGGLVETEHDYLNAALNWLLALFAR